MKDRQRAAIYVRVSTDGQVDSDTPETQRQRLATFAEQHAYEVAGWYEDLGVSGTVPFGDRPGGGALMAAAERGEFDVVIVTAIDRLARQMASAVPAYNRLHSVLKKHGDEVPVVSVTQSFDGTASGKFMLNIFFAVAEYERDVIRDRTSSGRSRKVREGTLYQASTVPYGFRRAGKLIEVDPDTSEAVKLMYTWCASGSGLQEIARRLDEHGYSPPMANGHEKRRGRYPGWNFSSVYKILVNPRNVGRGSYGKRPNQPAISMPCPALIDEGLYERALAAMTRRRFDAPRTAQSFYLLRGLLVCRECGSRFTVSKPKQQDPVYECATRRRHGRKAGHGDVRWRFRASEIEPLVLDAARSVLTDPASHADRLDDETTRYLASLDETEAEGLSASHRLARLDQEERRAQELFVKGLADEATLVNLLARVRSDRAEATAKLDELSPVLRAIDELRETARNFMSLIESLSDSGDIVDQAPEAQRATLLSMVERIWIEPDMNLIFEGPGDVSVYRSFR